MRAHHILACIAARYAKLAPVIGVAATVYALFVAFGSLGASHATWRTAMGGLLHAVAAAVVLLPTSISLIAVYELVRGRGGNNSAA